tara:strand:- start:318 stop:536 length:219 start_codon:yes stop_codon:yes gene_type:complete
MTMIHLNNDPEKINTLKIKSLLVALKNEAINPNGLRFFRGSIVNLLKRYFPELPRTKKGAYKYLLKKGYYVQ